MVTIHGIIHIHSLYSYDGQESLKDIKHFFKNKGYNFIIITEHSKELEDDKLRAFISECKLLSEDDFFVIPGLEFLCTDNLEILGLNISEKLNSSNVERLIEEIQRKGGLAILAHPHRYKSYNFNFKKKYHMFKNLNGVEVWNRLYDGKYTPRIANINLLKSLRETNRNIFGYAGLDYHKNAHYTELAHYVTVDKMEPKQIILSLKEGKFYAGNDKIKLNSKAEIKFYEYIWFSFCNLVYDYIKWCIRIGSEITKHTNIKLPECLKKVMNKIL